MLCCVLVSFFLVGSVTCVVCRVQSGVQHGSKKDGGRQADHVGEPCYQKQAMCFGAKVSVVYADGPLCFLRRGQGDSRWGFSFHCS